MSLKILFEVYKWHNFKIMTNNKDIMTEIKVYARIIKKPLRIKLKWKMMSVGKAECSDLKWPWCDTAASEGHRAGWWVETVQGPEEPWCAPLAFPDLEAIKRSRLNLRQTWRNHQSTRDWRWQHYLLWFPEEGFAWFLSLCVGVLKRFRIIGFKKKKSSFPTLLSSRWPSSWVK